MNAEVINKILGITESFKMPDKLLDLILSDRAEETFDKFMDQGEELDHDWFWEYFEEEHSNKSKLSQDFTPHCIGEILCGINPKAEKIADICAGTGGLAIEMWNNNKDAFFLCEEISERALPILLFNLAIRNMNAEVWNHDILADTETNIYYITSGAKYSKITKFNEQVSKMAISAKGEFDLVVANPPYSLKWTGNNDMRFTRHGIAPTSKADYAFVEHGLYILKNNGTANFILPHGVLFRGQKEGAIRQSLIDTHLIKAIIGLPDKLFLNTQIPVCVMQFKEGSSEILFVNAEEEFEKAGKINIINAEQIAKIIKTVNNHEQVEGLSKKAGIGEIQKNDYNLNIPRYVEKIAVEEVIKLQDVLAELIETDKKIKTATIELIEMMEQWTYQDKQEEAEVKAQIARYKEEVTGG